MKVYIKERCADIQKAKTELLRAHFCGDKNYEIRHLQSGRPILVCAQEEVGYISISHTDDTLIIAFADKPVGIDIERRSRKVSPKVCGSIEEWTRREAYGKWLGVGINKEVLSAQLPDNIINTIYYGEFVVSVCGEEVVDGETVIDNSYDA
ncbi:MAG: hypothetical protein K2H36_07010 [Clostridia bacterium]|nr:hypothetical protein [Clostridia bacterium]